MLEYKRNKISTSILEWVLCGTVIKFPTQSYLEIFYLKLTKKNQIKDEILFWMMLVFAILF